MKLYKKYFKSAIYILQHEGWRSFFVSAAERLLRAKKYQIWWQLHKPKKRELASMKGEIAAWNYLPKISVVMPVYDPEARFLQRAIESVSKQIYENWEFCICDDHSKNPKIRLILEECARKDVRIKVCFHEKNQNISEASNSALKLATGDYVTFLDHDDEIPPNALFEILKTLQKGKTDVFYSDEDKIDSHGRHNTPFFKPDWSPELLLSIMYLGHLLVIRRSLVEEVGGFRRGYEGSQDYDLALRCVEKAKKITHIPKILYHWRQHSGSTSTDIDTKSYAMPAAKKTLKNALERRSIHGEVVDGIWAGSYRVKRKISPNWKVSIIIPFRDKVEILKKCIDSIKKNTNYHNYKLIVMDNQSVKKETHEFLKTQDSTTILKYPQAFNFSKINNVATKKAKGEFLLFLNNDTEVLEPKWLQALLEYASDPEIAAVGAKLLYPNGTVQHAGVVLGIAGTCSHAFRHVSDSLHGYMGLKDVIRNVSAVTGACLMIEKKKFEELGGFDEKFEVAYQDVDLCLRALEKGYRNVYTPFAKLIHHESLTREQSFGEHDTELLLKKWKHLIQKGDPYYNPNLTKQREDFRLD